MSWQALLNVEELAFSNAGFLSRNDPAVVDAFIRLRDSRLTPRMSRSRSTGAATMTTCRPST